MQSLNWFLLFCLASLWAVSFPAISLSLTEINPLATVFWRLVPAGVILMIIALLRGHRFPLTVQFWSPFMVLALFFNVIPFILIANGQTHIEAGLASILNATTPIFTAVLAHFAFVNERLNTLKVVGLIIGLSGVGVLFGLDAFARFSWHNYGQLLVILAGCCYAFAGVFAKRFTLNYPILKSTAAMLLCSAGLAFLVTLGAEGWPQLAQSAAVWGALGFMSLFGTALAFVLYYFLIGRMGATGVSLVTFIVPPIAIFLGWLVLHEQLALNAYVGMFLIFTGLICMDERVQAWRYGK